MSNGNGYARETLESILESLESDESDEADERDEEASRSRGRGRGGSRGRSGPRTAPDSGSYRPPTQNTYVTQKELQENIQRVDAKITTNSDAIKAVNTRVTTLDTDMSRLTTAVKKEAEERKKDINSLRSNVQLSALLPLLVKPASTTIGPVVGKGTATNPELPATKVLIDSQNTLTALLPLMLLGGMSPSSDGTSGTSGGSGGFNDPMTMLLLVLAISGGLGGGSNK